MCGIFSIYGTAFFKNKLKNFTVALSTLSQSRGQDATGIAIHDLANNQASLYKEPLKAKTFVKTTQFKALFENPFEKGACIIGHNRLATNGSNGYIENNQPIYKHNIICAQNGIMTNFDVIAQARSHHYSLDTYLILDLFHEALHESQDMTQALKALFQTVEGENNILFNILDHHLLILATNTGSLYYVEDLETGLFASTSERYSLQCFLDQFHFKTLEIKQLKPNHFLILDYQKNKLLIESFEQAKPIPHFTTFQKLGTKLVDLETQFFEGLRALRRCTRCILPHTFPGITFNEAGVCQICEQHTPLKLGSSDRLEAIFAEHRSRDGSPDCLVAFSGGRDSSYALHLIKTKYKMNPIAYSFDWGMVTDLARRNQARMCSQLGVEHIWVAADIARKRENIQKNVKAWMKKPDIGMVPLFMAGDKTFFYHANQIMKKNKLDLVVFSQNQLERTSFKTGYCGVKLSSGKKQVHQLNTIGKMRLAYYYLMQYLKNPSYINGSLVDVVAGFFSFYILNQDFTYFFDDEPWVESVVDDTLKQYGWEWDPSYSSSWRIGDGTAALYNYIYYMHAGFTENDCLRSNQIREGMITREEGLALCEKENIPRFKDIETYCQLIHVNFIDLINAIRSLKCQIPSEVKSKIVVSKCFT